MNNQPQQPTILPVIKVSNQAMETLRQRGIDAETIGLPRLSSGSAVITLETAQALKEDIKKAVLGCDDPEAKAALANAWANIAKAEAAVIKAIGAMPPTQQEGSKRGRKSFASAAPPIDVNPKP